MVTKYQIITPIGVGLDALTKGARWWSSLKKGGRKADDEREWRSGLR